MLSDSKETAKSENNTDPDFEDKAMTSQAVKTQLPPLARKDKTMGDSISLIGN